MIFRGFKTKNKFKILISLLALGLGLLGSFWYPRSNHEIRAQSASVRFAVIGDYGWAGQPEADVAKLVKSWNPAFIITTGDNNYESGSASTIDRNIGQYYHSFIFPYVGKYGAGASDNRFFPTLGNHDWYTSGAKPYLDYFVLPGNERYYDFTWGPIQFFAIDSDTQEPDGTSSSSIQATWLAGFLSASNAIWKLVYMHHPPYSSGQVGSTSRMQWPYRAWGATAVLAGHDHVYERIVKNGFPYFVNGLGGEERFPFRSTPVSGSQKRYNGDYGAMLVDASYTSITFKFINRNGSVIDTYTINVTSIAGRAPPRRPVTSPPARHAAVSGTIPASAHATDNVGVVGAQFKRLNGMS